MSGASDVVVASQETPTPTATPTGQTTTAGGVPEIGLIPAWIPDWVVSLGAAVVVALLAVLTARLVISLFGRRIARRFERPSITQMVLRGIRVSIYLVGLLTVLRIYGLSLGDLVLSVTVFTAVVGVILAPIVGSIISGVFLLADQPYEIGDMIEIADSNRRGFVDDITLRYTKIFTLDNTFVVVPNGEIRNRDVINYSAEDPRTRLSLDVVVTYEGNLEQARSLVERAARDVDMVIEGGPDIRVGAARYPAAPTCYIDTFGDHGVHLRLRYWIREPYKLLATRSKVQTNVWSRLEDADVEIAYPHQHHVFDETSGQVGVAMDEPSKNRGPVTGDEVDGTRVDGNSERE